MKKTIAASLLALASLSVPAQAPSPAAPPEDPAHNELRALRDGMLAAIKAGDIAKQVSYLHPNVVVTWQNAEVSRGREGVRKYLERMLKAPGHAVESFDATVNVDELTILYGGDTGVSWGSSKDRIKLTDGTDFAYDARWSAALVKEEGRWLVANLHASTNLFDNPLLAITKKMAWVAGAVALLAGIFAGWLLGRRGRRA